MTGFRAVYIYIYVVNVYCARVFVEYLGGSFEEVKKEYEG